MAEENPEANVDEGSEEETDNQEKLKRKRRERFGVPENETSSEPNKRTRSLLHAPLTQKIYTNPFSDGFSVGIDTMSDQQKTLIEQRMKRFGVPADTAVGENETSAKSVEGADGETAEKKQESEPGKSTESKRKRERTILNQPREERRDPLPEVKRKLDTVHIYGTDFASTADVFRYFNEFGPSTIEWIDDSSCNVIFADNIAAKRAVLLKGERGELIGKIGQNSDEGEEKEEEAKVDPQEKDVPVEGEPNDEPYNENHEENGASDPLKKQISFPPDEEYLHYWYNGPPCKSTIVKFRIATEEDKKGPRKKSLYYELERKTAQQQGKRRKNPKINAAASRKLRAKLPIKLIANDNLTMKVNAETINEKEFPEPYEDEFLIYEEARKLKEIEMQKQKLVDREKERKEIEELIKKKREEQKLQRQKRDTTDAEKNFGRFISKLLAKNAESTKEIALKQSQEEPLHAQNGEDTEKSNQTVQTTETKPTSTSANSQAPPKANETNAAPSYPNLDEEIDILGD